MLSLLLVFGTSNTFLPNHGFRLDIKLVKAQQ